MANPPRADPIVVEAYNADWPRQFTVLADRAAVALGSIPATIEHVGSTAVPGLAAKPIIDLDVIIAREDVLTAVARLTALGYAHEGDGGITGREAMRWPIGEARHHLYVCAPDTSAYLEHLAFRDYLRGHSEAALEYAELKRRLAARYASDREAYQVGKTAFIERALRTRSRSY